jgi:hypothetical protein
MEQPTKLNDSKRALRDSKAEPLASEAELNDSLLPLGHTLLYPEFRCRHKIQYVEHFLESHFLKPPLALPHGCWKTTSTQ